MKKRFFAGFILLFFAAGLFGAQQPWYLMEQGKRHFRSGAYGDAIIAFEDARRERIAQITRKEQDLIHVLTSPIARRLGDSLEMVEMYIAQRQETGAAAALAELYSRVPRETLQNSVQRALDELDRLRSYPEAEFWLGEAYRAEGELLLALRQYERAWQQRELLQTPGFEVEILYRLVEVNRLRQNYREMERRALEIIQGSDLFGQPRDMFWARETAASTHQLRAAMGRILENDGIDRFLVLYRYNNIVTERAHRFLGFFYHATGRHASAAEHLMFAFLIQNTILIEDIMRREFDFAYTTLEDLMNQVRTRPALMNFIEEVEYFRTISYLSSSLFATGRAIPSAQLWAFLAASPDAGIWGERARRSPRPILERPIQLP